MKYVILNDKKISKIGLGTWGISGDWGIKYRKKYLLSLFEYAWNRGINYFDLAPVYGKGFIDRVIADFKYKDKLIISTKIPAIKKPDLTNKKSEISDFYNIHYIDQSIYSLFKNLKRDHIDLLMLHNWHYDWSKKSFPILSHLNKYKKKGQIGAIGISIPNYMNRSFHNIDGFELIDFFMVPLNLIQQWPIEHIKKVKKKNKNIKILARSIFKQGLLGKNTKNSKKESFLLKKIEGQKNLNELLKKSNAFYDKKNIKGREFSYCIDFCLFNGANILTLGMSTKKQIDSNINSLSSFSTKK